MGATYRNKIRAGNGSALIMESEAILRRRQEDLDFKVFALDPALPGHGCNDLKELLERDEHEMNFPSWKDFVQRPALPVQKDVIQPPALPVQMDLPRPPSHPMEPPSPTTAVQRPVRARKCLPIRGRNRPQEA